MKSMPMPIAIANSSSSKSVCRSRACFHRFDCAIARRRVGHKRMEQMLCGMGDIVDSAIESCLICLGRFGETTQLPDELKR
jgi:hypothetical protein